MRINHTKPALLKWGAYAIGMAFLAIPTGVFAATPPVPGNLIQNAQMQATTTNGLPTDWFQGGYGTSTISYAYPVPGPETGDVGAQVTLSNYTTGAAEWYFQNVNVTGGGTYVFSDSYNSDSESYLIAQWTMNDGSLAYDSIATLPSTNGTWANTPQEVFPVPANAVSMTMLHLIQNSDGTLTTANYALTPYASTGQNAFSKAMVSLTFDDGWTSQYNNALPILNAAHMLGTFYIITQPVLDATAAAGTNVLDGNVSTSTVTGSTTAKWGDITNAFNDGAIFTDPSDQGYTFADTYTAPTTSTVTVEYCSVSMTASSTMITSCPTADVVPVVIGTLPAGTNAAASLPFTLPVASGSTDTVTPISISQTLSGSGILTASDPSLTESQEYMTESQILTLQADGHEIDSHTETHPDLDLETVSPSEATEEIDGSRSTLLSFGATPVDGFAYPFGDYNPSVEQMVSSAGYDNARTVDIGFNTTASDPLLLKSESVVASTTLPEVEAWIDTAVANKWWLVLTFHDVDPENIIEQNAEVYGTTPEMFQEIISYLQTQQQSGNLTVDSMDQGLAILKGSSVPAPSLPVATPVAGTYATSQDVSITSANSTSIRYTSDDSDPTCTTGTVYNGSITVATSTTLKAIGCANTLDSAVATFAYDITPATTTDATPPVITLNGDATINLTVGQAYSEAGATATDNVDGTDLVTIGGDVVDTSVAGVYHVTYDAVDSAGNHATQAIRTVIVSPITIVTTGGGGGGGGGSTPSGGNTPGYGHTYTLLDFNTLMANWGKTGTGIPGDFNGDGIVNILDFNMLLINWSN